MNSSTDGNKNDAKPGLSSPLKADSASHRASTIAQCQPVLGIAAARRLMFLVFVWLVLVQTGYLLWIGNGLSPARLSTDAYSEANVVRAADAYFRDGLASHHGLSRISFGTRFPTVGNLSEPGTASLTQAQRDEAVYTHYPPGAELLAGCMALLFGTDRTWVFRLLPTSLGLLAAALLFRSLARVFGPGQGAVIAVGCAILPMFSTYMPTLHYQGYSFALLLIQLSLLVRLFWGMAPRWSGYLPALLLCGFLQGWLSFDQCFVVSFVAVPLWFLRRAEGGAPPQWWLYSAVGVAATGFALAHLLHLFQVAAELGGVKPMLDDLQGAAAKYGSHPKHHGYFGLLAWAIKCYLVNFLDLTDWHFGPFMILTVLAVLPVVVSSWGTLDVGRGAAYRVSWQNCKDHLLPLCLALLVSLLWLLAMPLHARIHTHFIPRHFFVLYFCLLLAAVRSYHVRRISSESKATTGPISGWQTTGLPSEANRP